MKSNFIKRGIRSSEVFDDQNNVRRNYPALRAFESLAKTIFSAVNTIKRRGDVWGGYHTTSERYTFIIEKMTENPDHLIANEYFERMVKLSKEDADNIVRMLAGHSGIARYSVTVHEKIVVCERLYNSVKYRLSVGLNRVDHAAARKQVTEDANRFLNGPNYHGYLGNLKLGFEFSEALEKYHCATMQEYVGKIFYEIRARLFADKLTYIDMHAGLSDTAILALEEGKGELGDFIKLCIAYQVSTAAMFQVAGALMIHNSYIIKKTA